MKEEKEERKPVACPICGDLITPKWEPRYNGPRATCDYCEINWAES